MSHWLIVLARTLCPTLGLILGLTLLPAGPALAQGPLKVVASFSILADMVKNVGGDRVQVASLVGPDADAHTYEPTPADARTLAEANLVVINGLGLEGKIDRLVKTSGYKGPLAVASQGLRPLTMTDEDHGGKRITDPHAWQNLANGKLYVANIRQALAQVDPAGADVYTANAEAYAKQLDDLDAWVRAEFAKVPRAQRKMVTSHDAFGYFGQAYGLTLLAPSGVSTESEPSAKGVGQLIRQIKAEKIRALFVENMNDPRLIERIAKETGVQPGGELYSDALSAPDGPAPSYVQMFRNNVSKIVAALTATPAAQ